MSDKPDKEFLKLIDIVARLRGPEGCPWDQKQTADSFKSYLIEETHELTEAIDNNSSAHIKEELGDLLFQIAFLANIYEGEQQFTMSEAINGICEKMIRRHPHVFEGQQINSLEEQKRLWQSIKAKENDGKEKESHHFLKAVPASLPALRRAQRVSERAAQTGFEWSDIDMVLDKLLEEIQELRCARMENDPEKMTEELGDILFTVVNAGRFLKINTEDALRSATDKFIGRFMALEKIFASQDTPLSDANKEQLLKAWKRAKNH